MSNYKNEMRKIDQYHRASGVAHVGFGRIFSMGATRGFF